MKYTQAFLSKNPQTLQGIIGEKPRYIIFFGAGASYGSDSMVLQQNGILPPLGNKLLEALLIYPGLTKWNNLSETEINTFREKGFETAMEEFKEIKEWNDLSAEFDLAQYFSDFQILPLNLYLKLFTKIRAKKWHGAVVSLNYETLIEQAMLKNSIFPVVKGVTYYDELPPLENKILGEMCYPHGACNFFMEQSWFDPASSLSFINVSLTQKGGVYHILNKSNIAVACRNKIIPMLCRYQPQKPAPMKNYFIDGQQERCRQLFTTAKAITIIGVLCNPINDSHLWEPLAQTNAFLNYVEPNEINQNAFKKWAMSNGKKQGVSFAIIPKTFEEAFETIIQINNLRD